MFWLLLGQAVADKGGDPIFGWSLGEWVAVVVVVIVIVLIGSWALKRFGII